MLSAEKVSSGGRRQRDADRAIRPRLRSPGRPPPSRGVAREFWRLIARGVSSGDAAVVVGVSTPVGSRWFRHGGGMPPMSLAVPSGRYLSFAEREEIDHTLAGSGNRTGTDADAIQISRSGIPAGLVSIPLRYMHSPVEMVDLGDVEATVALLVAFAESLDSDVDLSR